MEKHTDKLFDKIESFFDKSVHLAEKGLDAFCHVSKKFLNNADNISNSLYEKMHQMYKNNGHDRFIRYASLPWSITIPVAYKYITMGAYSRLPIFQPGMHMIRAKVGGGKSLTSFVLAEMTLLATANGSYFTSPVEKPQLSEDGKYWYVHHRVVNMSDYYKDGKKVLNFNTDKYKDIHKDERHLQYNPRMNKGKKYNESFIPEHEDHLLMRHDGMEHIYMYSQHLKLDSQDMTTITYMHEVSTKKDIPIKRWLDSGDLKYIPVKLRFESYTIEPSFDGAMKRKKVAKFNLPVPYNVLERYDTLAERHKHAGLPVDYK
ncbi:MAG: hypothetical protein K8Q99_02100 [Acholeplasmataceae bacterium]|nr:hypothetical protein [Acholeplasmataceae bacterium]MCD4826558.1 hypothetical protein [Acholeplasmataceae bacterium]